MKSTLLIILWAALGGIATGSHAADAEPRSDRDDEHSQGGEVVNSLNGLDGRVTLRAGSNITIVPSGNSLKISAAGPPPNGVQTLNGLTGAVLLAPGTNITFSTSGNRIQVNAASAGGFNAWHRAGDIAAAGDFLGTLNDQPLEIMVNGMRALRLEPNTNGAPNVIGGSSLNFVAQGTVGATIGGGGALEYENSTFDATFRNASNSVSADFGAIAGGIGNSIQANAGWSAVGGGWSNTIEAESVFATISGGQANTIQASCIYSSIGGGGGNSIQTTFSTIAGGAQNTIESNSFATTIGGGYGNTIQAFCQHSTIGGGVANTIQTYANDSTIAGGVLNTIQTDALFSTLGGGYYNAIQTSSRFSTLGGGYHNTNTGYYAAIPGGDHNVASTSSFAAGHRAKAFSQGAFVWADSTDADVASTADNQFVARAAGGVVFYSTPNLTSGVSLAPGGGSWSMLSDRSTKENVAPVNVRTVLDQLCAVPLATWNYKTQDKSIRHLGPMAQDFHAAFQVGEDDKHITTVDADGVALAAIQGLNEIVKEKETRISELEKRLTDLEHIVARSTQTPK